MYYVPGVVRTCNHHDGEKVVRAVFSATGGMGTTAEIFYKRLASLISEKNNQDYATTMGWIRCCISFSLIRSAVMCVRGSRSSYHHPISPSSMPADLVATEGRVTRW